MFVKAIETVYYNGKRRHPEEWEDLKNGGRKKKRDADIFLIRERKGIKNKKEVVLTVERQYKSIRHAVVPAKVTMQDIEKVQAAKREVAAIEMFEKQQEELDMMDAATLVAQAKELGMTDEEIAMQALHRDDVNVVDGGLELAEVQEYTAVKTPEDIAAEEKANAEGGSGDRPVLE